MTPALGECLARHVTWVDTGDPFYPWTADVEGARWRLRINDFPEEALYTLFIGDTAIGDLDDWPAAWHRLS
jgi:hypothetical protein